MRFQRHLNHHQLSILQGSEEGKGRSEGGEEWESKIAAGACNRNDSIEVLRKHAGVSHPVTRTFGKMLRGAKGLLEVR